jgi:hypothetical protein
MDSYRLRRPAPGGLAKKVKDPWENDFARTGSDAKRSVALIFPMVGKIYECRLRRFQWLEKSGGGFAFEVVGFDPVPVEEEVERGDAGQSIAAAFVEDFERFVRKRFAEESGEYLVDDQKPENRVHDFQQVIAFHIDLLPNHWNRRGRFSCYYPSTSCFFCTFFMQSPTEPTPFE